MHKPEPVLGTPSERSGFWRSRAARVALAVGTLAVIGAAIWLLRPHTPSARQPAAGGYVAFAVPAGQAAADSGAAPTLGAPASDFTLTALDGTPVRLSALRGKTVVINFWATWCGPCRHEFPEFVKAYQQQADRGLVIVAVDVAEQHDQVERFAREFGATFPIVIDTDGAVVHRYRIAGLPTTLFIDREGVLRAQQLGPLTEDSLTRKLAQAGFAVRDNR